MHEMSLLADLMKKVKEIAAANDADEVVEVTVRLGAMAHISPDHLREHFVKAAVGTVAEGADLVVIESDDMADPNAQNIILDSIEVA
ncbi:MAG: hydrogenase/urease maturation nickel metallochaperone HypA [Rhodothermia bacterium]